MLLSGQLFWLLFSCNALRIDSDQLVVDIGAATCGFTGLDSTGFTGRGTTIGLGLARLDLATTVGGVGSLGVGACLATTTGFAALLGVVGLGRAGLGVAGFLLAITVAFCFDWGFNWGVALALPDAPAFFFAAIAGLITGLLATFAFGAFGLDALDFDAFALAAFDFAMICLQRVYHLTRSVSRKLVIALRASQLQVQLALSG